MARANGSGHSIVSWCHHPIMLVMPSAVLTGDASVAIDAAAAAPNGFGGQRAALRMLDDPAQIRKVYGCPEALGETVGIRCRQAGYSGGFLL